MDPKTNVKGFPPPFPHRTQPGKRHNPSDFAFGEATSLYTREASALRAPGSLFPHGEGFDALPEAFPRRGKVGAQAAG